MSSHHVKSNRTTNIEKTDSILIAEMKETVQKKAEKLEKIGHKEYIKQM